MTDRLWILGAPDPEMERIEELLEAAGETVAYAMRLARRVRGGEAYSAGRADGPDIETRLPRPTQIYLVECDGAPRYPLGDRLAELTAVGHKPVSIDHHRRGDPGYGRPPEEFLAASSTGQVMAALVSVQYGSAACPGGGIPTDSIFRRWQDVGIGVDADGRESGSPDLPDEFRCEGERLIYAPYYDGERGEDAAGWLLWTGSYGYEDGSSSTEWRIVPHDLVLHAASDHCPAAAYRGQCPGVEPGELMRWRLEGRARFQGRDVEQLLADVDRAISAIRQASSTCVRCGQTGQTGQCDGCGSMTTLCADLRGGHVPEAPEASLRLGIPILADGLSGEDRKKTVLLGDPWGDAVTAFLYGWAERQGLIDLYGHAARGFAGGYSPGYSPA